MNNFADLDPGPGLRDFACGTQTYDGHTGQDSDLRSFREMDLGVPVFAALDGRVISVQDGDYDRNYGVADAAVRQPRRPRARDRPLHDLRPPAEGHRAPAQPAGARGPADRLDRVERGLLSPSASLRLRILPPDGSPAVDRTGPAGFAVYYGRGRGGYAFRLALGQAATLAEAPLRRRRLAALGAQPAAEPGLGRAPTGRAR